jgi:hypothetical protein
MQDRHFRDDRILYLISSQSSSDLVPDQQGTSAHRCMFIRMTMIST